jgi:hypothetical protein
VEAKSGGFWPAWMMVGLLVTALTYGVFWKWSDVRKWRGLTRALVDEPGIEAVEMRKENGRLVVSGLRDPLAVRPESIAARRGIESSELAFRLEPFHSLEPRFAAQREEELTDRFEKVRRDEERRTGEQFAQLKRESRMLAETYLRSRFGSIDGVKLEIGKDRVRASGEVAEPGYSMLIRELPPFGDVLGTVDVSGVVNKTEGIVRQIAEKLNSMRFLFKSGSAEFEDGTLAIVREVAQLFAELQVNAKLLGKRASMEIHGLPMSGSNREYLEATTERRLMELHALLMNAGVPEAVIRGTTVDQCDGQQRDKGVAFLKVSVRE